MFVLAPGAHPFSLPGMFLFILQVLTKILLFTYIPGPSINLPHHIVCLSFTEFITVVILHLSVYFFNETLSLLLVYKLDEDLHMVSQHLSQYLYKTGIVVLKICPQML